MKLFNKVGNTSKLFNKSGNSNSLYGKLTHNHIKSHLHNPYQQEEKKYNNLEKKRN